MHIKSLDVDAVGKGNDCEVYVTVKCDEEYKNFFVKYFQLIEEQMTRGGASDADKHR